MSSAAVVIGTLRVKHQNVSVDSDRGQSEFIVVVIPGIKQAQQIAIMNNDKTVKWKDRSIL